VYPLELGCKFGAASLPALLGLLVTAVGFPAIGFLSMVLFKGEPKVFFGRFGTLVATLCIGVIVGVMGPFGCLARCVALTHTITTQVYAGVSLELFSFLSCLLIFFLTIKKSRMVSLLGKVLTPFLLLTLAAVMVGGLFSDQNFSPNFENSFSNFYQGLFVGYQTMDLLAALFFCHILFKPLNSYAEKNNLSVFRLALQTSCVASGLLVLTYAGFGLLSATHADLLKGVAPEFLLIRLSEYVLGSNGALLTMGLVVFACLTTAMALSAIFADFLTAELKLPYVYSLGATMVIAYFGATFGFSSIVAFLVPILDVLYPVLIVWSLYNLLRKKATLRILTDSEVSYAV
ncbi:MAG TPA: branched-chain amino acid transport system II carrier protein, partial [Chlamydiales bacterium]|nr:branched-chain amino acid transport system II carrier protein [Chlamydiales bacterium]